MSSPTGQSQIFAPGLLRERVVLVTGGGTGLGRASALELARCGASVIIAGRRADVLEQTAAEIAAETDGELAERWFRAGVTVTAVAAGTFDTEVMVKYPASVRAGMSRSVPLQRLGTVAEHAWLVALLSSPLGRAFSGSTVTLDGARDNWFGPWPPQALLDDAGQVPVEERREAGPA